MLHIVWAAPAIGNDTEEGTAPAMLSNSTSLHQAGMEGLVEVVQRRARERSQRFVGRTIEVLVEGPSRTDPSRLRGRSRHNKTVNFTGMAAPGEIVPVAIHGATSKTLAGEESLALRAIDWPISCAELRPHYERLEHELPVAG